MERPLRIAFFVGSFPVVSETFILRQITGLLDLGQDVDIYAETRAATDTPLHPAVGAYHLLERTTFMDMPVESAPWELPVCPVMDRAWVPGETDARRNLNRLAIALPKIARCLFRAPRLARKVLSRAEYGYQAESLSALYRLEKILECNEHYDVLHAHFGPIGNSFRFARELLRSPLVVSFHGYDFSTFPRKQGTGVYRKLFATADLFTTNSDYSRGQLERLGCPCEKIQKLPVGLNPDEFPFRAREKMAGQPFRIVTVGRLVEIKGHEYVIRAVAALREKAPSVRYDIVGEGPLRAKLERLVGELRLSDCVTFHGALAEDSVKRILAEADIFVLTSVSVEGDQEGQGLVLQEAQAMGLPVIATRHGAFPEGVLPDDSAFLVPERDVASLAERLEYLATHSELWPQMGRAGRKFVEERYDIRQLNARLLELYAKAMEEFRKHG